MPDAIKKTLNAIRMQFDLPANLRGEAICLLRDFDQDRLEILRRQIRRYRTG